jgi:hypothetical protein
MPRGSRKKVVDHPATAAKRERALQLLVEGRDLVDVAQAVGVDRRTLHRWRQDPEFSEELQARLDGIRDTWYARLVSMSDDALQGLHDMLRGKDRGGELVKADMARIKAVQVWSELLGHHKGNPARPVERTVEIETEDQLRKLLEELPAGMMREELDRRERKRAGEG